MAHPSRAMITPTITPKAGKISCTGPLDLKPGGLPVTHEPEAPTSVNLQKEEGLTHVLGQAFLSDRKSTRLNSSHLVISYAVFCLKKKTVYDDEKRRYLSMP